MTIVLWHSLLNRVKECQSATLLSYAKRTLDTRTTRERERERERRERERERERADREYGTK